MNRKTLSARVLSLLLAVMLMISALPLNVLANDAAELQNDQQQQYTVAFDVQDHGEAPEAQKIVSGGTVTEPEQAPTAKGYTFGGWYKEEACTNAWNFESDTVTGNVTLYAKWTEAPTTPMPQLTTASSSPIAYRYPVYNKTDGNFYENASSGIKEWKENGSCTDYTTIYYNSDDDKNMPATLDAGWYVVVGTVDYTKGGTVQNGITVSGAVHLILKDGCSLTVTGAQDCAGICVSGTGNSLTIYGQSTGSGKVTATGGQRGAGIGGGNRGDGSNITINGGKVTANGGNGGAGIGGGASGDGSYITINGGTVTATGGPLGAGIGGGSSGKGENITINGGNVTATGGSNGDGIGTGKYGNSSSNIKAAAALVVKAGSAETLTDDNIVQHDSTTDIASSLSNRRYVTVKLPSISVGEQTGSLTYGTAGSATYSVTQDPATPALSNYKVLWKNSQGEYVETAPDGVSASFGTVSSEGKATLTISANQNSKVTPAGEYQFKVTAQKNGADITSAEATLTVGKAKVTVPTAKSGLVYNGEKQTGVEKPSDAVYDLSGNTGTNAGNYTATASLNDTNNYEWNLEQPSSTDRSISWSIGQKEITVTAGTYKVSKVYDGTTAAGTATGDLSVSGIADTDKNTVSVTSGTIPAYNAKDVKSDYKITLPISISGDTNGNYKIKDDATTIDVTGEITKAASNKISGLAITGWTYSENANSPSITGATFGKDTVTYQYKVKDAGNETYTETVPTAAGDYTVKASIAGTDNYVGASATKDFSIAKKTIIVTSGITATNRDYIKDQRTVDLVVTNAVLDGKKDGDDLSVTAVGTMADDGAGTAKTVTISGIELTGTAKGNYVLATNGHQTETTVDIAKAASTVDAAPTANVLTYNGSNQKLVTAGNCSGGTMNYVLGTDDTTAPGAEASWSAAIPQGKDAGTYYVWYKVVGDGNHHDTEPACVTVKIQARSVKLVSLTETKTYDGYALTSDHVYGSSTKDSVDSVFSSEVENLKAAGSVKNVAEGEVTNTITYDTKATFRESNYNIDKTEGKLSITQRDVTVTALDASKDYDADDPVLTAKVEGTVGKETVAYTLKRTEGKDAGAYTITASGDQSQGNYSVTFVPGTFTINPKEDTAAKTDTEALAKIQKAYQENNPDKAVTVEMQVSDTDVNAADVTKIQAAAGNKKLVSYDASLVVKVDGELQSDAGDQNTELIKITYKFDFTKKANLQTYRVHGGSVDELTETANAKGEFVKYDKDAGTITVTACKYSTYGFAYDEVVDSPNTGITSDSAVLPAVVRLIVLAVALTFVVVMRRKKN